MNKKIRPLVDKLALKIGITSPNLTTSVKIPNNAICIERETIIIGSELLHLPKEILTSIIAHELCHANVDVKDRVIRAFNITYKSLDRENLWRSIFTSPFFFIFISYALAIWVDFTFHT